MISPSPDEAPAAQRARDMRLHWDRFADEDAMHYIDTARETWDRDEFLASGEAVVDEALDWAGDNVGRGRALDIGCGLGRFSHHLARHFERVDGVDISDAMIARARDMGLRDNVRLTRVSGSDLGPFEAECFDFAFSYLVLQHIPEERDVLSYLRELRRVLKPTGRAVLQFDTRRESWPARLYKALPDALLPRAHRRFIRRYRRDADRLRRALKELGFDVIAERGEETAEHFLLLG